MELDDRGGAAGGIAVAAARREKVWEGAGHGSILSNPTPADHSAEP
ncbi:MAG: hypothetical protein AVDCRST_MAG83-1943 [uncultured Arthrobacter sp.]|uniref:Uncharacterized protein n=1 Tax=uncultured Arthrobacter sp. TaxID=114050 RepID=A0A6J4IBS4_9MICC|nr:MAG: hypothetical protein AVDCRST_MAG83-1943 [uncultured Arthrobacter sp.]